MAQAYSTVNATDSALQFLVPTYWDDLLLVQAKTKFVLWEMGDKKPLPKDSGNIIKWSRYELRGAVNAATQGAAAAPTALSSVNVTATLTQFVDATTTSDVLQLTAIDDQIASAIEQLSYGAAKTLDIFARNTIIGLTGGVSSTNFDVVEGGQSNDGFIRLLHSFIAKISALTIATHTADIAEVGKVTAYLRTLNAPTFGDGFYHGVMHPHVEESIMADSTSVVSWAAWNNSNTDVGREKMERGYIGNIQGVKFWRSTNMFVHNSGTVATCSAYHTPIFGPGAFGTVDIDGGVKTYVVQGADSNNPAAQWATISYKITTACRVLNPSFGIILITN